MAVSVNVTQYHWTPSTALQVTWTVTPDQDTGFPDAVSITEFDASGNQLEATGQIPQPNGVITFPNLTPNTTYYYQFCTYTSDIPDCSAQDAYKGSTASKSPPPPPKPEVRIVTVQPFPRRLFKPQGLSSYVIEGNGFSLTWIASSPIELELALHNASGAFLRGLNIGGDPTSSGTVADFGVPTPGAAYSVAVRGTLQAQPVTDWSPSVKFTAPLNTHSLQEFLMTSALKGNNGIKQLLPALAPGHPHSLRTVMQI